MAKYWIGRTEEFGEGSQKIVKVEDKEIGVFFHKGQFYAYDNYCLHQGGPACEGVVIGKVETVLTEERTVLTERFSDSETHFVCPWHGWEYDLATGECAGNRALRLRGYEVEREGEDVYVCL